VLFVAATSSQSVMDHDEARSLTTPDARQGGQQVGATWGIPLALAMFLAWDILAALVTHGGFFSEGKAGITWSAGR
jgi:hypothetical protein